MHTQKRYLLMKKITVYYLVLICIVISPAYIFADSIEVSGTVSGNWTVDTVNIIGNIEIREADMLSINNGVTVMFRGEYFFNINGILKAMGNIDNPVLFTMADTIGFNNDTISNGGWKQIRIENHNSNLDSIIFSNCKFEYSKAVSEDSIYNYGGAICIRNSNNVSLKNCSFSNNYAFISGGGVYLENSSILIENNNFSNNRCGQTTELYGYGGGLCSDWSRAIIEHNYFTNNSSTGIGGGLCIRFSDSPVFFNVFENNFSALGGGFGILHIDTCKFTISNNLFINNGSQFFGGGISNSDCSPRYINNTIINNHCIGGGGGFYCKDSVVPVLVNNIIYGNTQYGGETNQIYLWDRLAQPNFYFNNIQDGIEAFDGTGGSEFIGEYQNNIDEDPLFENNTFIPKLHSPCINSGNPDTTGLMLSLFDIAGNNRIVDNIIDMGAYEQQEINSVKYYSSIDNIKIHKVYPNPSNSDVQIDFELMTNEKVTCSITDLNGKLIKEISNHNFEVGKNKIIWKLLDQPIISGVYVMTLKTSKTTKYTNIIINR